ncbi:MAG TPA: protein kinase [Ktedonobacteraceae bacterium]|nr:protein kinase [Ktedonobacteraceae bacterium]
MSGLTGTSLGRYQLEERLGRGGMSEVYLAFDERTRHSVAVKVVSSSHADYIERFHREAEAISNLHHAHILPALDYGEQEPWHYLVIPYIQMGTLRDRLQQQGPLSLEDAGALLEQIASALQFAHDQGIIHRDIKPSNILLRDNHYAYLADFGLAKSLDGGDTITQTGNLMGTPEYMAPELTEGPATTSSDLYALGILIYEMVTGQVPFSAETPIAVYWKQLRDQPVPPSQVNPAIPPSIEHVILRALDKVPHRRYSSANELAQAYIEALTFPNRVEEEEEVPPVLYDTTSMDEDLATFVPPVHAPAATAHTPHAPTHAGRLVLPNNPIVAPTATPPLRRRLVRQPIRNIMRKRPVRVAPPTLPPLEPPAPSMIHHATPPQPQIHVTSRRKRVRPRPKNLVLISVWVIVGMLIVVGLVLFFTYLYVMARP